MNTHIWIDLIDIIHLMNTRMELITEVDIAMATILHIMVTIATEGCIIFLNFSPAQRKKTLVEEFMC